MLSYRHAFHAGNFADVLKHSVLTLVLEYMTRKEKGFSYIDSHSGAGMYQLSDPYAQKTGEYKEGIAKLLGQKDLPPQLEPYIEMILGFNTLLNKDKKSEDKEDLEIYPGSPAIAKALTRRQDSINLFELHPSDHTLLIEYCSRWRKTHINQSDGYQGILSLVPPPSRRGVVLIDPPYELKEDYQKAVQTIISAYKKFITGTYILWYPVVQRSLVDQMQNTFLASDLRNLLQIEFSLDKDNEEYGMTGSGLFIINPPWLLKDQANAILPYLKVKLGNENSSYQLNQLIDE